MSPQLPTRGVTGPSTAAAISTASWNRLDHVASTSKNRKILAAVLHAENACTTDGPSHHIIDNRIIATIVHRAIHNNWDDVLVSAASSRHMTQREYGDILGAGTVFSEDVYTAILASSATESPALMSMLQNCTHYTSIQDATRGVWVAMVQGQIDAITADPGRVRAGR